MSEQKYIYVVLSSPGSIVAKTVHLLLRDKYTHASLALSSDLSVMYSFSREYLHYPFFARFRQESVEVGFLAKKSVLPAKVIALPVTDDQYEMVKTRIEHFISNRLSYGYNYIGMFMNLIGRAYSPKNRYTCSQFVSETLSNCGIARFNRAFSLIRPIMLANLDGTVVFEGDLKQYRHQLAPNLQHGRSLA